MSVKNIFEKKSKVFIPYITAGDPDLNTTRDVIHSLVKAGADIIEFGIPFSDPVADGAVNQRASERALKNNVSLDQILDFIGELRKEDILVPIVIFSYYNPILQMGLRNFAKKASEVKANAVLVVDLPPESASNYKNILDEYNLETIFLVSPTTSPERIKLIDEMTTGFIYYVARTGVTGVRSDISESLESEVKELKKHTIKPVSVGFGVSTPDQASIISSFADGVIVGSALVKLIEDNIGNSDLSDKVFSFASSLRERI